MKRKIKYIKRNKKINKVTKERKKEIESGEGEMKCPTHTPKKKKSSISNETKDKNKTE